MDQQIDMRQTIIEIGLRVNEHLERQEKELAAAVARFMDQESLTASIRCQEARLRNQFAELTKRLRSQA